MVLRLILSRLSRLKKLSATALSWAGAKVPPAIWDGIWIAEQFRFAFDDLDAKDTRINYVSFAEGTIIPEGESAEGAGVHRNTWRVAYTIEPIWDRMFRERV